MISKKVSEGVVSTQNKVVRGAYKYWRLNAGSINGSYEMNNTKIPDIKKLYWSQGVLIKVANSSVNPIDIYQKNLFYNIHKQTQKTARLGWNGFGKVVAMANFVGDIFKIGQPVVFCSCPQRTGAHGSFAIINQINVWRAPENISPEFCGSFAHPTLNAIHVVNLMIKERLHGKKILLVDVSGEAGAIAVQILHMMGYSVYSLSNSLNKDYFSTLNVKNAFAYDEPKSYAELVKERFDTIGNFSIPGDVNETNLYSLIKPKGTLYSSENLNNNYYVTETKCLRNSIANAILNYRFKRDYDVRTVRVGAGFSVEDFETAVSLLETGRIKVRLDKSYSLEDLAEGYERIEKHDSMGTIGVHMTEDNGRN